MKDHTPSLEPLPTNAAASGGSINAAASGGRRRVLLVTGMSGAGLSVALKALEDQGYEAVDNLRLSLVPALIHQGDGARRPIAVVIDSRTRDFNAEALLEQLEALTARPDLDVRLLFMECSDEVLQRRFTETRRRSRRCRL